MNKFALSSEGERLHQHTSSHEVHAAWQHAIHPSWDMLIGIRRDFQPSYPNRDWGFISLQGLAPFFIDVEATLYVSDEGQSNFSFTAGYELPLTERLVLEPEIEANFYDREDAAFDTGKGLASLEAGLRLRYEVTRNVAPYVGADWGRLYGDTADIATSAGDKTHEAVFVAGLRAWL